MRFPLVYFMGQRCQKVPIGVLAASRKSNSAFNPKHGP